MSYPHRIRLRGPWQVEPLSGLAPGGPLPAPLTLRMPGRLSDSALQHFRGRVRFRRAFGYPGRIDSFERVWLTFAGVEGRTVAELNGQKLGDLSGAGEFEVTALLRSRNIVVVDVECTTPTSGLWDEVALEVRAAAFLREVHFARTGSQLDARGVVVGASERPLDLYFLVNNHSEAFAQILPTASGQPFVLAAEMHDMPKSVFVPVRIELVNGGTVWYVVEGFVKSQSVGEADSSLS
jgi:hypothetical protein